MRAHLVRRADAARAGVLRHGILHRLEILPDVGAAGLVLAEDIVVAERVAEELEAVQAAPARFVAVMVHGKSGHHADVGVHRMADRHALLAEDAVVIVHPLLGLLRIDEGKGERADAEPRRQLDGLAVGAGHPHRRVRLLHRLRHHVAAGHFEILALETGVRIHRQHVEALLGGFAPHLALLLHRHAIAAELQRGGGFPGAEFHPPVGDEVERGDALRHARGMVVAGRHQHDAVAQADVLRALRAGGQEHFRRRRMRIFFEEMVLDFPRVIDAEAVGQFHLVERFLEELQLGALFPGPRQLVLVKDSKLHRVLLRAASRGRAEPPAPTPSPFSRRDCWRRYRRRTRSPGSAWPRTRASADG